MSAPYREVSSRLKKLLTEGRVIEGSLYRSDRGNTPRHQLSDRAQAKYRNIYVPADFAADVAAWSANWAEAKQERIRCCKWLGNRANRYVLEAKLVTPWGSAYSVMSVPIKPWHDKDEDEKRDLMEQNPSNSGALVRHDARGKRVECGRHAVPAANADANSPNGATKLRCGGICNP